MSERLPPDELGNVAENLFRTLCGQSRLVCNKSDRDVTGWDFVVEFPMARPDQAKPLDQRAARACPIQLKSTTGESGSRVSVKLSAIERLAKDPRPALLVIFRLRSDGAPIAGYVIHLIGQELGRVLQRLREAEARRALDINRATISFDYREVGTRFELSPEGLRAALEAAVGDDPASALQDKQRQLAELGYENGGLEGDALIWIEGPEHFNAMLLGLAPIRPKTLKLFDRRFGIRIPYEGVAFDSIEEFRVELPRIGRCNVIVRGKDFGRAAMFEADMLVPPPLADGPWLLVRHPDFSLTLREDGLNFQTAGVFEEGRKTLSAWVMLTRALVYLADGSGRIRIEPLVDDAPPLTLAIDQRLNGPYLEQLPTLAAFLDGWQQLLERAGLSMIEPFPFDSVWESHDARLAVDLLLNPEPVAFFEFDQLDEVGDSSSVKAIFFNSCTLANVAISYAVEVLLTATEDGHYRSSAFTAIDVRPAVSDLHDYGMEQAHIRGIRILIDPAHLTMLDPRENEPAVAGPETAS